MFCSGIGDMGPDHRHALGAGQGRDSVGIFDLARVGLIRRLEFVDAGIGVLEIDVHDRQLLAKAELAARRIGHHLVEQLARGLAVADHLRADDIHATSSVRRARAIVKPSGMPASGMKP
jgi:hypothetical protein